MVNMIVPSCNLIFYRASCGPFLPTWLYYIVLPAHPPARPIYFLIFSGASFEVLCLGRWWDSLDREMWPPGQEAAVMEDFEVN